MTTNNKPAHTPGKWVWVDCAGKRDWSSEAFQAGRIKLVSEANGSVVLEEWAEYAADAGLNMSDADAKLIAAAPLMAEALSQVRMHKCMFDTDEDFLRVCDLVTTALEAAGLNDEN